MPSGNITPPSAFKLSDFEILDILMVGHYSKTHLCRHKEQNSYYCLKIMVKGMPNDQIKYGTNEKNILSTLSHPGIIRLYASFYTESSFCLLLEFLPGGDLYNSIKKHKRLDPGYVRHYTVQLIIILEYLHSRSFAVRDLKPENLLIDSNGNLKLSDFGFCKIIHDRTWTFCGTPDYMAPEILASTGYNTSVDLWSLGILIFEMMAGYPPFHSLDQEELMHEPRKPESILFPEFFPPECIDLIKRLVVVEPSMRLGGGPGGMNDLRSHAWFSTYPKVDWVLMSKWKTYGPIIPICNSPTDNYKHDDYYTQNPDHPFN